VPPEAGRITEDGGHERATDVPVDLRPLVIGEQLSTAGGVLAA
jgi:hypothetical protein